MWCLCIMHKRFAFPHTYLTVIFSIYILFSLYLYFIHSEFPAAKLSILDYWFRQQNATWHIIRVASCVTWVYLKILSSNAIQAWFLVSVLYYKPLSTDFSSSWLELSLWRVPAACSASWAFELMLALALAPALHFLCSLILCYHIWFFPTESDLVEKEPCSFNSSRVCECRPGLFCQTPVLNTCIRCQQHTFCKPGFGVKVRGRNSRGPAYLSWAWP